MTSQPALKLRLTLYTRRGCGLCDEMKHVVAEVMQEFAADLEEIDVDGDFDLRGRFGAEVPVLFINGRKAFKYRATVEGLQRWLRRAR